MVHVLSKTVLPYPLPSVQGNAGAQTASLNMVTQLTCMGYRMCMVWPCYCFVDGLS